MKKNFYIFTGMIILFGIGITSNAFADSTGEAILNEIKAPNEEYVANNPSSSNEELIISDETQSMIDDTALQNPQVAQVANQIISDAQNNELITSEEINSLIQELLIDNEANQEDAYNRMLRERAMPSSNNLLASPNPIEITVTAARTYWNAGAALVKAGGYPNAAMYMRHAEVAIPFTKPTNHLSKNNAWAKQLCTDNGFMGQDFNWWKVNVRDKPNVNTATKSGTYYFTSGDPYYALAHVNYSRQYVRQSNGGFKVYTIITDYYDFALMNYDSIKTGFVNNYAFGMQTLGLIGNYNITIAYNS